MQDSVLIKNKKTGHTITVTAKAWENGRRFYVGYVKIEPVPEKKTKDPALKTLPETITEAIKPKKTRKKKEDKGLTDNE